MSRLLLNVAQRNKQSQQESREVYRSVRVPKKKQELLSQYIAGIRVKEQDIVFNDTL